MATMAQNGKRGREDEPEGSLPEAKKIKPTPGLPDCPPDKKKKSRREKENFSPAFWDKLSKLWLTHRALRELDRRNRLKYPPPRRVPLGDLSDVPDPLALAQFAEDGGPDLSHIRGWPEPRGAASMESTDPSTSRDSSSRQTKPTEGTGVSDQDGKKGRRRSSAYDQDFEQHLIDHNIYPYGHEYPDGRSTPEPLDLPDLSAARASLSPSRFPESAFRDFRRKDARAVLERDVMKQVIPIICGDDSHIATRRNVQFTGLESMTEDLTVDPRPDLFDGAKLEDLHPKVREDLGRFVIPTEYPKLPVAPNFFLEVKAPRGGTDVAKRQACYDGAYGARAMQSLRNYATEPGYDGKAHSYSSTYHDGTLALYSHHVAEPANRGGPEDHMAKLDSVSTTAKRDEVVRGAAACGNLRDTAKQRRDKFIHQPFEDDLSHPTATAPQLVSQDAHDEPPLENFDGSTSGASGLSNMQEGPVYGGNALAYNSAHHDDNSVPSVHHASLPKPLPATTRRQDEYHTTEIGFYGLRGNRENFVQGVTAFRNLRDIAKQDRVDIVQGANARARQQAGQDDDLAQPTDVSLTSQDGHDELPLQNFDADSYGAGAVNGLQNYGRNEPVYDGKAHAYSSTYQDGMLKLYSHQPTAPTTTDGREEYHMNQIGAYSLTGNREGFVAGATALRNTRDMAKEQRDNFSRAANARAQGVPSHPTTTEGQMAPQDAFDDTALQNLDVSGYGARPMDNLHDDGSEGPVFDDVINGDRSTYQAGTRKPSSHRRTEPAVPDGRQGYHMTKLKGIDMTDSREAFVQGATAFRNLRDVADRERQVAIQAANTRARQQSGQNDDDDDDDDDDDPPQRTEMQPGPRYGHDDPPFQNFDTSMAQNGSEDPALSGYYHADENGQDDDTQPFVPLDNVSNFGVDNNAGSKRSRDSKRPRDPKSPTSGGSKGRSTSGGGHSSRHSGSGSHDKRHKSGRSRK